MSLIMPRSITNFLVGMQPIFLKSHSCPTRPSIVVTMFIGFGYIAFTISLRSKKLEWFIKIRQGSFLPSLSIPILLSLNLVAQTSGSVIILSNVLNKILGFLGLILLLLGSCCNFSTVIDFTLIFIILSLYIFLKIIIA